jgi:hypothetical protein
MARMLALTALVLAASSAVGSGTASATASGSSPGLESATVQAADDACRDLTGSAPVDAAPAPHGWAELEPRDASQGDASSPHQIIALALAPLALAPKTSPPLALGH